MNVLVVNCGSSSIKYSLFAMSEGGSGDVLASGIVERIGEAGSRIRHETADASDVRDVEAPDHEAAFALVVEALTGGPHAVIPSLDRIDAVGHRCVHGAERFAESTRIDADVIAAIEACVPLAPLHNPPNLTGIRAAMAVMPDVPHVGVFDTAFHQTIPPHAFLYAVPYDLYTEHGIRRYGFHGTSHRYVSEVAAGMLGRPPDEVNLITAHLGNGCSIAAVRGGASVDTSLGMTPLEGLVMGTRSGDIDPAIIFHLMRTLGMDTDQVDDLLNRRSGLLGLSGVSNDMREVIRAAEGGNDRAHLAIEVFCYRLKKYIGAYTAVLGRVDALVFTGGIGENDAAARRRACDGLGLLGYVLDADRNAADSHGPRDVAAPESPIRILVIPTDEEALIARDTARIARGM
ncbi:MAG TPA: acetate kinase [Phycisphaerae bacterium]|nr:acetate kinase [Phycisphaerae bacterium]